MRKIAVLMVLALMYISVNAQEFMAGAAYRIITPDPLIPVSGGAGTPSPANIKKGELTTRALYVAKGSTKIAIVSIDNLGVPKVIGDRIRKLVKEIPAKNIIIGATHTHSAPDIYGFADEKGNSGTDLKYIDWLVKQTAEAINEAVKSAKPAYLKIAVDKAKGKIAYNYYAPKLYDPRCGVMQMVSAEDGKTIATLVNYAIHPEVIGSDRGVCTPDLIGPLYERIEEKTGGMAIFMNSAQGGMVTADNRLENGKEANDWNECKRIGHLLADESLRIISDAKIQKNPELYITSKDFDLPVESDLMKYILKYAIITYPVTKKSTISTRMNLANIGTAQILTIPGEALPNIGFYLKRKMKTKNPFLFGLTNDAYGYILTKEDYDSFKRYEYITRTSLGENTWVIIEKEALKLIKNSPGSENE